MTQAVNDGFVSQTSGPMLPRNDPLNRLGNLIATYQALPGLVCFYPMSSVQRSTGNAYDLAVQGRTLTYNGNPTYDVENLIPYIALDGTGDYLRRADETDLDIIGNETIFPAARRGLTIGAWVWFNALGSLEAVTGKLGAAGQRSFDCGKLSTNEIYFTVSSDGTAVTTVQSASTIVAQRWYFIMARFDPSTELSLNTNTGTNGSLVEAANTTSIPATLFNSTAGFNIGRRDDNTALVTGRITMTFLCAQYLPDYYAFTLFEQGRVLLGA